MPLPEKIASALSRIHQIVKENGGNILQTHQISRGDRELLLRTKWLVPIIQGWYLLVRPDISSGDSTVWYANFWDFIRTYLGEHFGNEYCLSANNSLDLHTESSQVPCQIIVIAPKGSGAPRELLHGTSLLIYQDSNGIPEERVSIRGGIQVMPLPLALCRVSSAFFQTNPLEAEIALNMIKVSSELSEFLIKNSYKSAADRLLGALKHLGKKTITEDLERDLEIMGWKLSGKNPFSKEEARPTSKRLDSPHSARISLMWKKYRGIVEETFPKPPGLPKDKATYLRHLEEIYERDAYNSLSIEGYQVNEELIERVQNHGWNPDAHQQDFQERNSLAARGYYEAFKEVEKSLHLIFQGENSGKVAERDLKRWYQKLFSKVARVGIIAEHDLVGYRKGQVYIRNSRHVPLPKESLIDAMETLFGCLEEEPHPAVRAVLGHYFFVYIHPYMDGNGRIGRFLMNAMFASGGYPWTIVQTASDMRIATNKRGGSIGAPGSVAYNFDRKGVIQVKRENAEEETLFMEVSEAGADDFDTEDELYMIVTPPEKLFEVKDKIDAMGIPVEEASLTMIPKVLVEADEKTRSSNEGLIAFLEELDDVDAVYSNMD